MKKMKFKMEERRYKVFRISRKQMLQLITGEVQIQNIPEWSTILEVQPDFQTRGWIIMVHHPSFPEVPEGQISEDINLEFISFEHGKRKLTFK
jgi:hypothetical protein